MRVVALLAATALAPGAASSAAPSPPFRASVSAVRASDLRHSYRAGCPVRPADLRLVRLSYRGFDGRAHTGALVVSRRVTREVTAVFRRLYAVGFPIRRMVPVDAYGGSDTASMAADNTSGFNCRRAVGSATGGWLAHAYGEAIDVNPVENPYVVGERTLPPAGARYTDRNRVRPGMAVRRGVLVDTFAEAGWQWGGRWAATPDYQHFSTSGN